MKSKILALLIVGLMVSGLTAYAHHSFTATYDEDAQVQIEGQLVQFLFRNPHSWVHVWLPMTMVRWFATASNGVEPASWAARV